MKFSYVIEAIVLWIAFQLFRLMGADTASAVGGWVGRTIGPRLGASRKASVNLEKSFPELSQEQYDAYILEMWDNLGRVVAEYPHMKKIIADHTEIVGTEYLDAIGRDKPFILIGGHLANWELVPISVNYRLHIRIAAIFREPNNPFAAKLLDKCRHFEDKGVYIPKSHAGTRNMVQTLREGRPLAILIDQKYNQGAPVEFFGRPAMTTTAPAQLALKYNVPILPMQCARVGGNRFKIIIHPPLDIAGKDESTIMLELNRMLEGWVRERPGQWLWLHRRWDSKALQ
jgi:Kdo2-lipid IVA lauroyltransferase/acyltransferase